MLAGDPMLRSYSESINDSRSIRFRCLSGTDTSGQGAGPDTPGMPTTNCVGGVRSEINFPTSVTWNTCISLPLTFFPILFFLTLCYLCFALTIIRCWNGKDLDSANHKVRNGYINLVYVAETAVLGPCSVCDRRKLW